MMSLGMKILIRMQSIDRLHNIIAIFIITMSKSSFSSIDITLSQMTHLYIPVWLCILLDKYLIGQRLILNIQGKNQSEQLVIVCLFIPSLSIPL